MSQPTVEPRSERLLVCVTKSDRERLANLARAADTSMSGMVRRLIRAADLEATDAA